MGFDERYAVCQTTITIPNGTETAVYNITMDNDLNVISTQFKIPDQLNYKAKSTPISCCLDVQVSISIKKGQCLTFSDIQSSVRKALTDMLGELVDINILNMITTINISGGGYLSYTSSLAAIKNQFDILEKIVVNIEGCSMNLSNLHFNPLVEYNLINCTLIMHIAHNGLKLDEELFQVVDRPDEFIDFDSAAIFAKNLIDLMVGNSHVNIYNTSLFVNYPDNIRFYKADIGKYEDIFGEFSVYMKAIQECCIESSSPVHYYWIYPNEIIQTSNLSIDKSKSYITFNKEANTENSECETFSITINVKSPTDMDDKLYNLFTILGYNIDRFCAFLYDNVTVDKPYEIYLDFEKMPNNERFIFHYFPCIDSPIIKTNPTRRTNLQIILNVTALLDNESELSLTSALSLFSVISANLQHGGINSYSIIFNIDGTNITECSLDFISVISHLNQINFINFNNRQIKVAGSINIDSAPSLNFLNIALLKVRSKFFNIIDSTDSLIIFKGTDNESRLLRNQIRLENSNVDFIHDTEGDNAFIYSLSNKISENFDTFDIALLPQNDLQGLVLPKTLITTFIEDMPLIPEMKSSNSEVKSF